MTVYKFTEYSTGEPLVSIEYSYDDAALTMTRRAGSKSETLSISVENFPPFSVQYFPLLKAAERDLCVV